jgi:glycolate dehydrogenase FAD-binding subunit
MQPVFYLDGLPLSVERPSNISELAELVRRAQSSKEAIYPLGGRTMTGLGLPPTKPGFGVDLRGLDRVIDYPARDMTITVEAGITIERLQEVLRAENQWLPVDVPLPDQATLGGAMATNASGPRRYGYGTLRDYVIGISVINEEGQEIKAGGRVVKNVAGYDLMKLYIGSLGTLGIISQITLKVKPRPEASRLFVLPCDLNALQPVLDCIHGSRTQPVCVEVWDSAGFAMIQRQAVGDGPWMVMVMLEGTTSAVEWQANQLRQELSKTAGAELSEIADWQTSSVGTGLRDFALWPDARLSFKANLLPSAVAGFCREAAKLSPRHILQAHAGSGIVIGHVSADLTREQAATMLTTLTPIAAAAHGNLIVTRCPPEWKRDLPVWGRSTGDRVLMRSVKQKLDPHGIFNPGRFVDGI